jgi:putative heme-binding domain-containing protein
MKFTARRATGLFLFGGLLLGSGLTGLAGDATNVDSASRTAIAVEALSRLKGMDLEANPAIKKAVLKVLEQTRGTPQFVELVRDFNLQDQDDALLEYAAQNPASSAGVEAMRLVLSRPDTGLLKTALAGTNAINVVEALGNTGENGIVPLLLPLVTELARELAVRKQCIRALAQLQTGAASLLKLAEEQKLPADLKLTASSALNNVRWENLKAQAALLLPLPQGREAQPLPPVSELVLLIGDPAKGAAIFHSETVACDKCHQVNGVGVDFGPSLSEIGTKLGKDALYESIFDPSAGISFGFEAWQINLKDGDEAYGLIVSETADELAVKAVGGVVTRYPKANIASQTKQKLSVMPSGLQQAMTRQELVDLVEYLSSLKKTGP